MMIGTWCRRPSSGRIFVGDRVAVELGCSVTSSRISVGRSALHSRRPSVPSAAIDDVVPLLLQRVLQQALDVRVVVDDEDFPGQSVLPARCVNQTAASRTLGPRRRRRSV